MSKPNHASSTIIAAPPTANLTAVTSTSETALWDAATYTPIPANDASVGRVYIVRAGGIMSFNSTGTLTITPRFGLTVSGTTLGASIAQTTPGSTTAQPWYLELVCVIRSVGAPGANTVAIATGSFVTNATGSAGTGVSLAFGGTAATVDTSIASGICIGWTLSIAGTVTPQFFLMQSLY